VLQVARRRLAKKRVSGVYWKQWPGWAASGQRRDAGHRVMRGESNKNLRRSGECHAARVWALAWSVASAAASAVLLCGSQAGELDAALVVIPPVARQGLLGAPEASPHHPPESRSTPSVGGRSTEHTSLCPTAPGASRAPEGAEVEEMHKVGLQFPPRRCRGHRPASRAVVLARSPSTHLLVAAMSPLPLPRTPLLDIHRPPVSCSRQPQKSPVSLEFAVQPTSCPKFGETTRSSGVFWTLRRRTGC